MKIILISQWYELCMLPEFSCIVDIKINTWSPLYVNLRIKLIFIQYPALNEEIKHWSSTVSTVDIEIKSIQHKSFQRWNLKNLSRGLNPPKPAKTRFKFSAGLNLETFDTILSGTNHI